MVIVENDGSFSLHSVRGFRFFLIGVLLTAKQPNIQVTPSRGQQILTVETLVPKVSFLSLPGELRNVIYVLVSLPTDQIYNIVTYRPPGDAKPRRAVQHSFMEDTHHGMVFDHSRGKWDPTPSDGTISLALASKQIAAEILPMIYGDNVFAFRTFGCMNIFLREIDRNRQHLRKLHVTDEKAYIFSQPGKAFSGLLPASNLQQISVGAEIIGLGFRGERLRESIERFVDEFMPLMGSWRSANTDTSGSPSALDLVQVIYNCKRCGRSMADMPPTLQNRDCLCRSHDRKAERARVIRRKLREAFAEHMGVTDLTASQ